MVQHHRNGTFPVRRTRTLTAAAALGLIAAMAAPTAALGHEAVQTDVRFEGNYLMADTQLLGADTGTEGPIASIRLDVYDGKLRFGKTGWQTGALVNATARDHRWEITSAATCQVEVEQWTAETMVYPPGTNVTFTSPYDGALSVDLMMHGELATFDGVVVNGDECSRGMEPTSVTDLGSVPLHVAAGWTSVVTFRGKKLETVRTTVEYTSITFAGVDLVPDVNGESLACSMARRMPIQAIEFIDNHG